MSTTPTPTPATSTAPTAPYSPLPPWPLYFTKMHGLGNDFMVLDCTRQIIDLQPEHIRRMADRHFGVGFDQLLMVEPGPSDDIDFGYRIFNADGSEVEQCGNGARCFARFVLDQGLTEKHSIRVQTRAGTIVLRITDSGDVEVNMGVPRLLPEQIPFVAEQAALSHTVAVQEGSDETVQLSVVNMGNPHAVLRVDDVDSAPVPRLGPLLEHHPRFPARVNVGFVQVLSPSHIRLRVHERGAGETLACGTGACAAAVAGQRMGWLGQEVTVDLPGGRLHIRWAGEGQPVFMQGPAVHVYDGLWLWPDQPRKKSHTAAAHTGVRS